MKLTNTIMGSLTGKLGIVFGVANKRSIAWAIAQAWAKEGAKLAFTYQGERLKDNVEELAGTFGADTLIMPCDVTKDEDIARVFAEVGQKFGKLHLMLHSVAFAPKAALEGEFVNTDREAFRVAHDVSAYSLIALSRAAAPLMAEGGLLEPETAQSYEIGARGRFLDQRLAVPHDPLTHHDRGAFDLLGLAHDFEHIAKKGQAFRFNETIL